MTEDNIELELENALKRNEQKEEIKASNAFIVDDRLILFLESDVCLGEKISKIEEISEMKADTLKPKIIGFGGTLHFEDSEIFISVDGLVRDIMKEMPIAAMRSTVASLNGSMRSKKKAVSSARNGSMRGKKQKQKEVA